MSSYLRHRSGGGLYSFTVVSYKRRPLLCDAPVRAALRHAILSTRSAYPFSIHAWVLMPDHMHCVWSLPAGDDDYSRRWSDIKRQVSACCAHQYADFPMSISRIKRRESAIWQRRFWEHHIRDEREYKRCLDYIHYNPVKHGLVCAVGDWPYSSFHRWVRAGVYQDNWAGGERVEMAGEFGE